MNFYALFCIDCVVKNVLNREHYKHTPTVSCLAELSCRMSFLLRSRLSKARWNTRWNRVGAVFSAAAVMQTKADEGKDPIHIPAAKHLHMRRVQAKDETSKAARQNPIYQRCACQIWKDMVQAPIATTSFQVACKVSEDEDDMCHYNDDTKVPRNQNTKAVQTLEKDLADRGYQVSLRYEQLYHNEEVARRLGLMPVEDGAIWHFAISTTKQ